MSQTDQFHDLAAESLSESFISDSSTPIEAVDAYHEARDAVLDTLATADALSDKLAEIDANKVYLQREGYEQLRREAIDGAKELAKQAQRTYERSKAVAESALLKSALPRLESDSREGLARQELLIALGDSQGGDASSRLLGIAKSGSTEVQAVLGTDFARTVLIGRGSANVDKTLQAARRVVAESAQTPEAVKARDNIARLDKLARAQAAAAAALRHSLPSF